ncbi:conserved hypothetical protein [Ricinus communis]|uniref:Uncharacterized protein n=1 Tax=Ricinus communis TaxID=3988 RepID=B9RPM2_RICCO|nr:conserved hypothetical protein [Ricinus communis]
MLKKVKEETIKQSSDAQEESVEGTKSQTSNIDKKSDYEEEKSYDSEKSSDLTEKEREETKRKSKAEANVRIVVSSDQNSIGNLFSEIVAALNSHLITLSNQQLCIDLDPSSDVYHLLKEIQQKHSDLEKTVSTFEKSLREEFRQYNQTSIWKKMFDINEGVKRLSSRTEKTSIKEATDVVKKKTRKAHESENLVSSTDEER